MYLRSGGVDPGRDGCRVPLPWSGDRGAVRVQPRRRDRPSRGSASPTRWAALTVEAQRDDPGSMLNLYRAALRIRRDRAGPGDGSMRWLPTRPRACSPSRAATRFVAITNLSPDAVALPADGELLLASADLDDGRLPSDASAWIRSHRRQPRPGVPGGRQGKRDEEELMTAEPLGWGEPQRCDPSLDPDEPTKASRPE